MCSAIIVCMLQEKCGSEHRRGERLCFVGWAASCVMRVAMNLVLADAVCGTFVMF